MPAIIFIFLLATVGTPVQTTVIKEHAQNHVL